MHGNVTVLSSHLLLLLLLSLVFHGLQRLGHFAFRLFMAAIPPGELYGNNEQ